MRVRVSVCWNDIVEFIYLNNLQKNNITHFHEIMNRKKGAGEKREREKERGREKEGE